MGCDLYQRLRYEAEGGVLARLPRPGCFPVGVLAHAVR